ncbi:MAG: fibrillarin-like rRNA/tRNA 2'-O-methyltransferase [Candidatus Methanofastidiosia archaeon]
MKEKFSNVYYDDVGFLTKNLVPGTRVYGEKLVTYDEEEYRAWNPNRSKLASALMLGLTIIPFTPSSKVLYLGSATGTTVSHISDIVSDGTIYCVEFSPRSMRDFIGNAKMRNNLVPILADAKQPIEYAPLLETVDVIYQDIAQVEQAEIMLRNLPFLKKGGHIMLCIKARSIDVTKDPKEMFKKEIETLSQAVDIIEIIDIGQYEKDHSFVVGIKR